MKTKTFFLAFLLGATLATYAQGTEKRVRVYKGNTIAYEEKYADVDSIVFVEVDPPIIYNEDGVLNGIFSVSATKKVRFTRGNLQYQASTNLWRFAEHQYDYVGNKDRGNVYVDSIKSNNEKISSTYDGWIDLFGWGASGYKGVDPYTAIFNTGSYGQPGTNYIDLTNSDYDWGQYCVISNADDKSGLWHTLTRPEWIYLFETRPNASFLRGFVSIEDVHGYMLLPDDWTVHTEPLFTPSVNDYTTNAYTLEEWQALEELGAVFLPAAGFRWESGYGSVTSVNTDGYYWTATANVSASANRVSIRLSVIKTDDYSMRNGGHSVRLVQTVTTEE